MIWVRLFNHRSGGGPYFAERVFLVAHQILQFEGTRLRHGFEAYSIPPGGRMEIGS